MPNTANQPANQRGCALVGVWVFAGNRGHSAKMRCQRMRESATVDSYTVAPSRNPIGKRPERTRQESRTFNHEVTKERQPSRRLFSLRERYPRAHFPIASATRCDEQTEKIVSLRESPRRSNPSVSQTQPIADRFLTRVPPQSSFPYARLPAKHALTHEVHLLAAASRLLRDSKGSELTSR